MTVESFRGPGGATLSYRRDDFTDPWIEAPTIVLQHGFPRNSNMFYAWVPHLARDFRVVRPDLRGLGLSKVPSQGFENSLESLRSDAVALFDHLNADKVIWVGEATGGLLGMTLGALVPERIMGVIVFTSSLSMTNWRLPEYAKDLAPGEAVLGTDGMAYMQRAGMRAWARACAKTRPWLQREPSPDYVEWYVNELTNNDPLLCAEFFRPMPAVDVRPYLPAMRVPLLYLDGTWGHALDRDDLTFLKQQACATVVEIDGPGMDLGYARPEACVTEVRAWLTSFGIGPKP